MKTIKVNWSYEIPDNFIGPVEYPDGDIWWYKNCLLHRLDGPAMQNLNFDNRYWILGEELTEEEFEIFRVMWERTLFEKTDELALIFINLVLLK